MIELTRPQACQYINTHNVTISDVINCNNNIQTGDLGQTFYQTLYTAKNTFKDDVKPRDLVASQVCRRLLRAQAAARSGHDEESNNSETAKTKKMWVEGLSLVLSGVRAATSRTATSAPMAHTQVIQRGNRFTFSHSFADLLLGQLEKVLDGSSNSVTFIYRVCRTRDNVEKQWEDVSANDYIHRPKDLEDMCIYEQTMLFQKRFRKKQRKDTDDFLDDLVFASDHPGHGFAYLERESNYRVPLVSIPKGGLCRVKDLGLNLLDASEQIMKNRERYAKTALMLFYPLRNLDDIQMDGSYWKKFDSIRCSHFGISNSDYGIEICTQHNFFPRGFDILRNIETRLTVEKCHGRAMDPLTDITTCPIAEEDSKNNKINIQQDEEEEVPDIALFCQTKNDNDNSFDGIDFDAEEDM